MASDDLIATDQAFFDALNEMFKGNIDPMLSLWSHRQDTVYMGPNHKVLIGWSDIRPSWEFQGGLKMGGEISVTERHITEGSELAVVHHVAEATHLSPAGEGAISLRGTNVFRKEDGVWKLIAHHSDPIAFLDATS